MQQFFERYWVFGGTCLLFALVTLRLIIRERVTLQGTLAFLLLLFGMGLASLFPQADAWIATRMGFTLVSNWFFALCIAALSFLHLLALIAISRVELRSIALTQELALLQEKLERALPAVGERP